MSQDDSNKDEHNDSFKKFIEDYKEAIHEPSNSQPKTIKLNKEWNKKYNLTEFHLTFESKSDDSMNKISNIQSLYEEASGNFKNESQNNIPQTKESVPAYVPKRRKKDRIMDTHTSSAYYIQNDILAAIEEVVGDEWGGKYKLVNDALKLYFHTFHKEHADRIKDLR